MREREVGREREKGHVRSRSAAERATDQEGKRTTEHA